MKKGEKGKGKGKKDSKKADTTKKGNTTKKGDTTKVTQLDTDNEVSATSGSVETVVRTAKTKLIDNSLKPPPYFRIINLDSVCQMLREIYGYAKFDILITFQYTELLTNLQNSGRGKKQRT